MLGNHNLPSTQGKKKKRLGRGNASSGNYSGRGMKGQRARSGGKGGLKLRGLKQSMMAVPKIRGFRSPHPKAQEVNLKDLQTTFEDGATVTVQELELRGLIRSAKKPVKILGQGELKKKLTVHAHAASKTAQEAITKVGGTVELIKRKPIPKRGSKKKPAQDGGDKA